MMRIAGVQMDFQLADNAGNLERMIDKLRESRRAGAALTIFPECALSGYCFSSLDEARPHTESIPGPSVQRMTGVCAELGGHVVYGLLESDGVRVFNALALVGPRGLVASYRKTHLPFLGVDMFTDHGDRPFAVHEVDGVRVGMNICYDGGFPEPARCLTLLGADLNDPLVLILSFNHGATLGGVVR